MSGDRRRSDDESYSAIMATLEDIATEGARMPSRGPGQTVSGHNLFATWLDYRTEGKGLERTDVLDELNERIGRKYDNSRLYHWVTGKQPVPDAVLEIVDEDMEKVVRWLFKSRDWSSSGVSIRQLADALRPPIKRD